MLRRSAFPPTAASHKDFILLCVPPSFHPSVRCCRNSKDHDIIICCLFFPKTRLLFSVISAYLKRTKSLPAHAAFHSDRDMESHRMSKENLLSSLGVRFDVKLRGENTIAQNELKKFSLLLLLSRGPHPLQDVAHYSVCQSHACNQFNAPPHIQPALSGRLGSVFSSSSSFILLFLSFTLLLSFTLSLWLQGQKSNRGGSEDRAF